MTMDKLVLQPEKEMDTPSMQAAKRFGEFLDYMAGVGPCPKEWLKKDGVEDGNV